MDIVEYAESITGEPLIDNFKRMLEVSYKLQKEGKLHTYDIRRGHYPYLKQDIDTILKELTQNAQTLDSSI